MFLAQLTKKERKLVKEVSKMQLASLHSILNGTSEEDLDLISIQNEISRDDIIKATQANFDKFEELLWRPGLITALDPDNVSIVKTIITKFFDKPKYAKGRRGVWKKLKFAAFVPEYPPMLN
jgi:hypothetical protein